MMGCGFPATITGIRKEITQPTPGRKHSRTHRFWRETQLSKVPFLIILRISHHSLSRYLVKDGLESHQTQRNSSFLRGLRPALFPVCPSNSVYLFVWVDRKQRNEKKDGEAKPLKKTTTANERARLGLVGVLEEERVTVPFFPCLSPLGLVPKTA